MKTYIYIIFILLICSSCSSGKKKENSHETSSNIEFELKLDTTLMKAVCELIDYKDYEKYEIPLSESVIIIYFFKRREIDVGTSYSIEVHHYVSGFDYIADDYKGIIDMDGHKIAIFDENDIGRKFYNADSLQYIAFDSFKSYPMDVIITPAFFVKDGVLLSWKEGVSQQSE